DTEVSLISNAVEITSTKKAAPKPKSDGPPLPTLIISAVSESKERKGVSLSAVKKALAAKGVDVVKLVTNGTLAQTKGSGASGSFKLAKKEPKAAKPAAKKVAKKAPAKAKKPAAKKATPKKTPVKKSPKKVAAKKTPVKKATKKPAAKSPKKAAPKKAVKKTPVKKTPTKKTAAKKTAAKKAKK
uniref:H15 domain-containing protein n=1 Tax=Labrus bergylta TaxID=56723 RepID=A0A3Q3GI38_9LABR